MTHHVVDGMPADAKITENVIKQLGKKLRLMEGFASVHSAERFTRLLIACYRFKRFTDSCRRDGNGKSPLELAGVDPLPADGSGADVGSATTTAATLNLTLSIYVSHRAAVQCVVDRARCIRLQ